MNKDKTKTLKKMIKIKKIFKKSQMCMRSKKKERNVGRKR